jgi:hypothetical protein
MSSGIRSIVLLAAGFAAGVSALAGNADRRLDAAPADVSEKGFTVRLEIELSDVKADEALYSAGPVKLYLRRAGLDKELFKYDSMSGNYLNFPMPNGGCPVIEAVIAEKAGRVGIPLALFAASGGVHRVTIDYSPVKWAIAAGGHVDEEFPVPASPVRWPDDACERIESKRVHAASFISPSVPGVIPVQTGPKRITRSIQYWTPDGFNQWVGDVAPGTFNGKLHLFYLIDRRHHGSGAGTGRHQFAHLVIDDLVNWTELPLAVPIEESWQTCGTGTPFMKEGRLALAFGWHTSRYPEFKGKPLGGTYTVSDDGVAFTKSEVIITDAQNPSIYNMPGGGYELVTSYGGEIGIYRSKDLLKWELFDAKLPFRGDCPSLFDWHGRRYLLQGFYRMAYNPDGSAGGFTDWTNEPDKLYEGLSVPMVTSWKGNRRIYIGWMRHLGGWGGWLVFRELVYHPDGRLGMKWVPEIEPPVPPRVFRVKGGEAFSAVFVSESGAPDLRLSVDPAKRTADWKDDAKDAKFTNAYEAMNVRIGAVRGLDADYEVKVIAYYDAKSDATLFDAEIAGGRTLICRRPGKYRASE